MQRCNYILTFNNFKITLDFWFEQVKCIEYCFYVLLLILLKSKLAKICLEWRICKWIHMYVYRNIRMYILVYILHIIHLISLFIFSWGFATSFCSTPFHFMPEEVYLCWKLVLISMYAILGCCNFLLYKQKHAYITLIA